MQNAVELPLSVTIDGVSFTAARIVTGVRKLRQRIEFRGYVEHDSQTYAPHETEEMAAWAKLILWQLVVRGWPGQSPLAPPAPRE